jgi:glycosyltransferase involved in cell wall biosynthesis
LKRKLLIISTHPIQYNAPLFNYLSGSGNFELKVFYTNGQPDDKIFDKEFGKERSWKIDLLKGYDHEFLENKGYSSLLPSFFSIVNPQITQRIDAFKPSMIIIYGWNYFSHLQILLKYNGKVPIVFRGDSTSIDDDEKNIFHLYFRYKFLKWVYRRTDYILSPGSASDTYFSKCGVLRSKIIRVPHAVENNWFTSFSVEEVSEIKAIKTELNLQDGNFVFLFAGKFIEKKNPLLLVDAFSVLAKELPNVRLLIVGDGELESAIRKRVNELTEIISKRITILPFQDQPAMKIIYRLANFFVLPSKGPAETWGLSVNEALACGTPVLVSDRCGCAAEIVGEGVNGFIFQSGNLQSLITQMKKCCEKGIWEQYSSNATSSVSNYNFQAYKAAIDHLICPIEN